MALRHKSARNYVAPFTILRSWDKVFNGGVPWHFFRNTSHCVFLPNNSILELKSICPQSILPVVLWNIQVVFCKLQTCSNFILDSSVFLFCSFLLTSLLLNVLPYLFYIWQQKCSEMFSKFLADTKILHLNKHSVLCSCSHVTFRLGALNLSPKW